MDMLKRGETVRISRGNKIIISVPVTLNRNVGFDIKLVRKEVEAGKIYAMADLFREALKSSVSESIGKIMPVTDEQVEEIVNYLCKDMTEKIDTSKYLGEYYVRDTYKTDDNTTYVLCRKKSDLSICFEYIYKNS